MSFAFCYFSLAWIHDDWRRFSRKLTAVFGLLHFLTWCQKWETKNSPLEQIFKKNIDKTPSQFQGLLFRRLRFDVHVKDGRSIPVTDALSRVCHRKVGRNVEHVTEGSTSQRNIHFMSTPIDLTVVNQHRPIPWVYWRILSSTPSLRTESYARNCGSSGTFDATPQ